MKKSTIILYAIIILLVAGGIWYYFYKSPVSNQNGQVACTQEAFLCPDGSYVGRHGAQCKFDVCQKNGPFIGKLEQTNSGFRLLMESPEKQIGEITYSLPLEIKISNVLAQFVNQRVIVYGAFNAGNIFAVDHLEGAPISDATLGEVGVGKSVFINGVLITLNKIVQDSRCPIDVQCIQAGSVTANVSLKSDTDKETINMQSDKPAISFDSFMISIENIKPNKIAAQTPDLQYYILTFKVISR